MQNFKFSNYFTSTLSSNTTYNFSIENDLIIYQYDDFYLEVKNITEDRLIIKLEFEYEIINYICLKNQLFVHLDNNEVKVYNVFNGIEISSFDNVDVSDSYEDSYAIYKIGNKMKIIDSSLSEVNFFVGEDFEFFIYNSHIFVMATYLKIFNFNGKMIFQSMKELETWIDYEEGILIFYKDNTHQLITPELIFK